MSRRICIAESPLVKVTQESFVRSWLCTMAGSGKKGPGTGHRGQVQENKAPEEPLCMEVYRKNAEGRVRRAILCGNLQEKGQRHGSQEPFSALREAHFGRTLKHIV